MTRGTRKPTAKVGSILHVHGLLSVLEAAELLGISVWTLHPCLSQRRLALIKIGCLTKLRLENVEMFIN